LLEQSDSCSSRCESSTVTLELDARNFALFELLDQSQRDGTAVVRSSRFRLGTRVVRVARTVLRKEAVFRPPGAILDRQRQIEQWRSRLATERRSRDRPRAGALRVTYVLPELRMSGGALVVMQLVNEAAAARCRRARCGAARTARPAAGVFRWRLQITPTVFADEHALVAGLPAADVVVATHWTTAAWVRELVDAGERSKLRTSCRTTSPGSIRGRIGGAGTRESERMRSSRTRL